MILVDEIFVNVISRNILKSYMSMLIIFSTAIFLEIHIAFEIIKLLIKKGNQNYIHNENSYMHLNHSSKMRKLNKLYNEV